MNDRTIPNLRMSLTNHLVLSGPEERDLLSILDEVECLRDEVAELRALAEVRAVEVTLLTEKGKMHCGECVIVGKGEGRCGR